MTGHWEHFATYGVYGVCSHCYVITSSHLRDGFHAVLSTVGD